MNQYGLSAQRLGMSLQAGQLPATPGSLQQQRMLFERKLTSAARDDLSKSSFVYPDQKRYPIPDRSHASNALARSSGKSAEGKVRAAVCKKYPDMPSCKGGGKKD